jgi:hypothetical protein
MMLASIQQHGPPGKAGVQKLQDYVWIPAFAGMTNWMDSISEWPIRYLGS